MKKLALITLMLAACNEQAKSKKNLAVDIVGAVEENAKCTEVFTDEGQHHTYATYCKLANKAIVFCQLDVEGGFRCLPLNGQAQPPQPPSTQQVPTPADVQPTPPTTPQHPTPVPGPKK